MTVTHVFFGMPRVLIDPARLRTRYPDALAAVLVREVGGSVDRWRDAYRAVVEDWDRYHADLNFSGDDGLADMREGRFRVMRGLFRLAEMPEPDKSTLHDLADRLPVMAMSRCDAVYADVRTTLTRLRERGLSVGVASTLVSQQARALLVGGRALDCVDGVIAGADVTGRFEQDARFYARLAQMARVSPSACMVVDGSPVALRGAAAAGMVTAAVVRGGLYDILHAPS